MLKVVNFNMQLGFQVVVNKCQVCYIRVCVCDYSNLCYNPRPYILIGAFSNAFVVAIMINGLFWFSSKNLIK